MEREKAIYAVRIAGKDGWQVYYPPMMKDELVLHLKGNGLKCLEFAKAFPILGMKDDTAELECVTFTDSVIQDNGWMYDSQKECWRAPGETYFEPVELPVVPNSFDVISHRPEYGWWDIAFVVNDIEYWIISSNVYDPLCDYHNLILSVMSGRDIRITVDEERHFTDISIYCKTNGKIRLILKLLGGNKQMEADILINGVEFVQRLYKQMRDLFGDAKIFEKGWLQESEDWHDWEDGETFEDYIEGIKRERGYPSYSVEEIERYLEGQYFRNRKQ